MRSILRPKLLSIPVLILMFISPSCSEKVPFSPLDISEGQGVQNTLTTSSQSCSNFTLIKPPVDFLFIWDNSSSTIALAYGVKQSIQKTLDTISDRFDYHILLAPLIADSNAQNDFNNYSLVVDNTNGLTSQTSGGVTRNPMNILKQRENVNIFSGTLPSSLEQGFLRARTVIQDNRSNGIFRNNAYTIVVMISNEDDDDYPCSNCSNGNPSAANNINDHITAFTNLKSQMNPLSFRFMSVVGQGGTCAPNASKVGHRYSAMSTSMYVSSNSTDQNLGKISYSLPNNNTNMFQKYYDSYNICTSNFSDMFYGINQSITEITQKHIYGYWPLAGPGAQPFDPNQITVTKDNGQVLIQGDTTNGFVLLPGIQTKNTRIGPTPPGPGEPFTGYLLQLYGAGQITFPECLIVKTQTPAEYYGYFVISRAPDLGFPITITINGVNIPQSNTNGWQYLGATTPPAFPNNNVNIKVQGPILNPGNPHAPATPAINKSGYVFKLNGNAILTNGQVININYKPAPL